MGEQLVSQWIGCIANRSWLFRWGRVKMSFLVKPTLYDVSYIKRKMVAREGQLTKIPPSRLACTLASNSTTR
jgi:hypothetical protein